MQSQSWLVDAWFLFLFFFISRSLHLCSPLGCSCSNSSCCYSCSGLYECVRWKMFALEKVPKILTLLHTFSIWWWAFSLSCCGCKHGRLKSQFSPASVLHLFSQFDLLLFSLTRGWGALHARTHAYSYKCIKREQGLFYTFRRRGLCRCEIFFCMGKCFDHNHCVQWKEWVMYRREGMLRSIFSPLLQNKKRGSFQVFNVWCRNRTVSSTTQYILHVPKYILFKGFSLECAQYR